MNKHTPGPWAAWSPVSTGSLNPQGAAFVVGPTRIMMDKSSGFSLADANLIAAAPDLLLALEGFLDNEKQSSFECWQANRRPSGDCDSVHSQWLESSEYEDFLDLYGDEIAAIAKARGES